MWLLLAFLPRIPQDPAYHNFADQRVFLGVPNLLNVISNAPFLVVGVLGWILSRAITDAGERAAVRALFAGVMATAFGSSWYHLSPADETLFWDRLPMAVVFMALFSLVIADGFDVRLRMLLWPMIAAGIASVVCWRVTGDLKVYLLVQFLPMLAIPAMMLLLPARYTHHANLCAVIGWYALAKVLELLDTRIFALGQTPPPDCVPHMRIASCSSRPAASHSPHDRDDHARRRRSRLTCPGTLSSKQLAETLFTLSIYEIGNSDVG